MRCPHCTTENRDDRESCYHCGRDLAMLRLICSRAKTHFNNAVSHTEKNEFHEALGELNSALELNNRLIEAHVLKGTLLARMERIDDARAAYEAALALHPQGIRAHRYLLDLGAVPAALPLVRRTRIAVAASAAVGALALFGAATLVHFRPAGSEDPAVARERAAWAALRAGDLAGARREALAIGREEAARAILAESAAYVQRRLDAALVLAHSGRGEEAVGIVRDLERGQLPDDMKEQAARTLDEVKRKLVSAVEAAFAPIPLAPADRERAELLAARTAEWLPDARPDIERVVARRSQRVREEFLRVAADLDAAVSGDDFATAAPPLVQRASALAEHAESADHLAVRKAALAGRFAGVRYAEALKAAKAGDVREFEAAAAAIRAIPGVPEEIVRKAEALRSVFTEREQQRLREALRAAIGAGENARVLEVAQALEGLGDTLDEGLREQVAAARERVAIGAYYKLMEWGDRIERREIDAESAAEVVRLVEASRGLLPPRLGARAEENIAFFGAVAYEVLGEGDKAQQLQRVLYERFPESPYLRKLQPPPT